MEARQLLRNKLDVLSKDEIVKDYLRKDGKLSDLSLPTAEAKRQACRAIGAAYAEEYQPCWRIRDGCTWRTAAREQIPRGCLSARSGISCPYRGISIPHAGTAATGAASWPSSRTDTAPRYSVRCSAADWNDDHKYNRGSSFTIYGGSRRIQLYERGMYNVNVELNFTYFV